jgi:hypothetical protein
MRYSDRLVPGTDSLADHRKVLRKLGYVWAGKVGRGLTLAPFLHQLQDDIVTYLYLATFTTSGHRLTRGRITAIQTKPPDEQGIPDYYKSFRFVPRVGMWMRLSDLRAVQPFERVRLVVISSGNHITTTLALSSAGIFIVRKLKPHEQAMPISRSLWQERTQQVISKLHDDDDDGLDLRRESLDDLYEEMEASDD